MGLDIRMVEIVNLDHAWSSSYSTFGEFRRKLATCEGVTLEHMVGFGGRREWDEVETVLKPLLNHSDCDGELHPYEYEIAMVDRLRGLLKLEIFDGYEREWGERLVDALEMCKQEWENGSRELRLVFA